MHLRPRYGTEALIKPSPPPDTSSGGFAALGRFLFGSRTGSSHAMIVPGKDGPDGKETLEEPTGESDLEEENPTESVEAMLKGVSSDGGGNGGSLTAGSTSASSSERVNSSSECAMVVPGGEEDGGGGVAAPEAAQPLAVGADAPFSDAAAAAAAAAAGVVAVAPAMADAADASSSSSEEEEESSSEEAEEGEGGGIYRVSSPQPGAVETTSVPEVAERETRATLLQSAKASAARVATSNVGEKPVLSWNRRSSRTARASAVRELAWSGDNGEGWDPSAGPLTPSTPKRSSGAPVRGRAASLLSGERKTGLAALQNKGPPARATRRALLEESKQRRVSENRPRQGIFETLRQRSSENFAATLADANRESPASRQDLGRSLGRQEKQPSPFADAVTVSPGSSSDENGSDEEKEAVGGEGIGVGGVGEAHLRGEGGGVDLGEGDSEEVEDDASDSDDDEEPDFWSKYGVIDASALDEDVEIEI
eukprot:jgi/Undpi1/12661/HiC_scaffold_6.g02329.m1